MKRLVAILLSLAMILSLVACNKGGDAGKETSSKGEETYNGPMSLEEVPHPTKDPFGKYEETITVTTIHTANDGAFWFPEGDTIDNNIYTRTFEEELGIHYEFKWTCPSAQGAEKLNTMIVSGDLPDFFSVDRTTFEKLYAAGLLEDLTVPIIEYASDYTRKYLSGDYKYLMDAATKDGKYYGLVNGFSYQDGGDMIWVRKDWLDKLGLSVPSTLEELEAIMDAFVNKDPDGNGKDDTYAIAMNGAEATGYTLSNSFFNIFNSFPYSWLENSKGEIESGMFGEEARVNTRLALEKAAEYCEKGYINPEFTTMTWEQMNEDVFNGKCGIYFADVWGAYWPLLLHLDVDPNADWIPIPIVTSEYGDGYIMRDAAQVANILVARKGVEHPEALVKMANLYHNLNNNPETMKFAEYNTNPEDNNQIFCCFPLLIYNPSFNYEGYCLISEAQRTGNTDALCEGYKLFYDQAQSYAESKDPAGWPPYRSYIDGETSLSVVDSYIKNHRIKFNEYTDSATEFMIENEPTVKKLWDEMVAAVIIGKKDISAFDEFIGQWDSIYGNTATKEVNDWFKAKGGVSIQSQMGK